MDKRDINIIVNVKQEDLNFINGVIAQGTLNQNDEMKKFVKDNNIDKINVEYKLMDDESEKR